MAGLEIKSGSAIFMCVINLCVPDIEKVKLLDGLLLHITAKAMKDNIIVSQKEAISTVIMILKVNA